METKNTVFIAQSLDGYIADKNGGLEWLETIPNPERKDMGYLPFMERIDAIVMGRSTYEVVRNFGIPWPYTKPVFVLSHTIGSLPAELKGKVELLKGEVTEVLQSIRSKGYARLYIDGGVTIHNFLKEDLIDELIISRIPILLGGGIPLFKDFPNELVFKHIKSELFLNEIVQDHYERKR